jgi:hypothetical protein
MQGFGGLFLGLLPTPVISARRGDIGVTHKSLHNADIDPVVEEVGNARTA